MFFHNTSSLIVTLGSILFRCPTQANLIFRDQRSIGASSSSIREKQLLRGHTRRNNCAFSSCAPPRFDNFLDSILGSWKTDSDDTVRNVEEVMRSCGGAVQGVKEIKYENAVFDQMYHNRADDGFTFFDCGSYSYGPTDLQKNDDDDSYEDLKKTSFVSNFSFSTTYKSRTIISTSPDTASLFLMKPAFGKEHSELSEQSTIKPIILSSAPENIKWHQEMVCKMASPSQPWMLQRAKWGKYNHDFENIPNIEDPIQTSTWVATFTFDKSSSAKGEYQPWSSDELSDWFSLSEVSKIIQIGNIHDADNVKAFLRCYGIQGKLKAIVFQNGTTITRA